MRTVNDIRQAFIDYFVANGHAEVASSPLVPLNDPTLMFTNAGMVQFKNVFTGSEHRDYNRAVTSQKCVRAGGKHNDLENVGYTARHHTFFEMLGNFSFGDYFKDEAIELAWNLITKEFGLPADKLLATVYADDDQAFDLWKKIAGLPEDRIIRIATSDNFWSMGDTGPCGPCSEIFYDHGDHIPGGPPGSPDEDGDRFIEIWNLVFMQYEQLSAEERVDLPKPSVDTGMGLERIAAVMQGTHDNYETDMMQALIHASAEASHTDANGEHKVSHRVIADHLRATSFLIADGVLPSNEGRGYVLRRIMRRAMRHAHMMGASDPTIYKLVPSLVTQMGQAFPELSRAEALISETLKLEESRFKTTLDRGLKLLDEATDSLGENGVLDGETAFKLYDTYGFPLDLTQDALRNRQMTVDEDGFNTAMERQRAEARAAWSGSGDAATEEVWFAIHDELGATEFQGYTREEIEGQVTAIVVDGERVDEAAEGTSAAVIVNQTPFYGESGGQMGDTGEILYAEGARFKVSDTQKKLGDLHVHHGTVGEHVLKVGDTVRLIVDGDRRADLRANHSATHLLHEALRRSLGDHVTQKGSMVSPDRLRFDISHPKAVDGDELSAAEAEVNALIRGNSEVTTRLMTPDEAIEAGAMALFGEKYGDEVRVVAMGTSVGDSVGDSNDGAYSTELCGGTHVRRTGDIGLMKVISEGAVASGVRRVEALTGRGALEYLEAQETALQTTASLLKAQPADVAERVQSLLDERKKLERELAETRKKLAAGGGDGGGGAESAIKDIGGVAFSPRLLDGMPAKDMKGLADEIKQQMGSGVVALVSVNDGKVSLVVGVSDSLTDKIDAVELVRAGSQAVGGKGGGGRADMAQAGGPDGDKAEAALQAIEAALAG
ncbi:MAG: alanine--tRNA ligase [Rhodospirillaceae bacterium]|nr:alanine--tRNA ligase [Rhodospirillaceae bacterium]MBT4218491.1 alanine--tRNA ligase [Rhodospirillaceae bacterium]MBT4464734.1 alanine--tRNA ligase [Rhodospirillaceae bacterium]MBT5307915.1 alanine--tRNA ligase [Rhodospirillaceae bacterium]